MGPASAEPARASVPCPPRERLALGGDDDEPDAALFRLGSPFGRMVIHVLGAGVAGLTTAARLAEAGRVVVVHEASMELGQRAASWLAGGMLAPYCEAATADPAIIAPGLRGIDFWAERAPVSRRGTLVLAAPRDAADLRQFAARTQAHRLLDAAGIEEIEPDLGGRFRQGLFFEAEAHLDPRLAMATLEIGRAHV